MLSWAAISGLLRPCDRAWSTWASRVVRLTRRAQRREPGVSQRVGHRLAGPRLLEDLLEVAAGAREHTGDLGTQAGDALDPVSVLDDEGWFPTKDIATLDEAGYLRQIAEQGRVFDERGRMQPLRPREPDPRARSRGCG